MKNKSFFFFNVVNENISRDLNPYDKLNNDELSAVIKDLANPDEDFYRRMGQGLTDFAERALEYFANNGLNTEYGVVHTQIQRIRRPDFQPILITQSIDDFQKTKKI